ncbi:unnamed protein product [Schistosoma turkestanicum]|nr:unnamed protein product [Schistosoma turkestanicum]
MLTKISITFIQIPKDISGRKTRSRIINELKCKNKTLNTYRFIPYSIIDVPNYLFKSGTLVEYRPMPKFCSKQNSPEQCFDSSRERIRCYWCSAIEKCSNGGDIHTLKWLENECYKTNISQP